MNELFQYNRVMDSLNRLMPKLPHIAATVAVNFSKERFIQQNWIGTSTVSWKRRKVVGKMRDRGRAILVKTARLKRDVQKISVSANGALIGTTKMTSPYAKAHNEGFKGTVTVESYKRKRYRKVTEEYTKRTKVHGYGGTEAYIDKKRKRTRKEIDTGKGEIVVRTHKRKMNIPQRQFIGESPVLDKRIERTITAEMIRSIKTAL